MARDHIILSWRLSEAYYVQVGAGRPLAETKITNARSLCSYHYNDNELINSDHFIKNLHVKSVMNKPEINNKIVIYLLRTSRL